MSQKPPSTKPPFVNCHAHIFTSDHVPPLLAKSFVIWPFYYLLSLRLVLPLIRLGIDIRDHRFKPNSLGRTRRLILMTINRFWISRLLVALLSIYLSVNALFIVLMWLTGIISPGDKVTAWIAQISDYLNSYYLLFPFDSNTVNWLTVLIVLILIPDGRKLIFLVVKSLYRFISRFPTKRIGDLAERYFLMGRFSFKQEQHNVYANLRDQYPENTQFVVLPMDMKYMKAGDPKTDYLSQLNELNVLKKSRALLHPFVFVDPRRITEDRKKNKSKLTFFNYTITNGKIDLAPGTVIHEYLSINQFSGLKIYPALGYYPFDRELLPLWLYAAQKGIPVMTHCVKGVIFYRGAKKYAWNWHPILKEPDGDKGNRKLELPERKNADFSANFTHPLNYLCLLSEPLLRSWVGTLDQNIQNLFGYNGPEKPMDRDLTELKICLAHYGGEEEWLRYLEKDRYPYAQRLIQNRQSGLTFKVNLRKMDVSDWNSLSNIWKYVDWYSIISSLMLQFPNVYSDISYILSKPRIWPLLNETLSKEINSELRTKVLFGTDFYMVRSHNSEKDLMAQIHSNLNEEDLDQIARFNAEKYLNRE